MNKELIEDLNWEHRQTIKLLEEAIEASQNGDFEEMRKLHDEAERHKARYEELRRLNDM